MIVIACGALLAAAFITLLRLARGETLRPRPLRPLQLAVQGRKPVAMDYGYCPECTARRYGSVHLDGSFTCGCGHHQPVTGAITIETPAPAPHTGAGAGTTKGDL